MTARRKLLAGVAVLSLAGGGTGAALAARGHSASTPPRLVQGKSLLVAASAYLGIPLTQLKGELRPGHPLAAVAGSTPGRSVAGLRAALYHDAAWNLREGHSAVSKQRMSFISTWMRKRIAGFVAGTCPLELGQLFIRLGGSCPGMGMA